MTDRTREPASGGSARAWVVGLLGLALLGLVAILVRTAWLCDDAYITFRTVDNLQNGHGLTWNVGERVQAYTHPLWMLLVSAATGVTGNLYATVLSLGVLLTVATALVVVRMLGVGWGSLTALAILALSRSFVDYSTSGLENPLSHLLLALFVALYFRPGEAPHEPRRVFVLALLAGLAATTRMDTLLLYLPALLTLLRGGGLGGRLSRLALGFTPFLAWELFSLVYYGFPFPNSAYAKLGTGIPAGELARQGLAYLDNSFDNDPLTLASLVTAGAITALRRSRRSVPLAVGALLYVVYVVRIGGDFMSGRMLSLTLLLSALLIGREAAASTWARAVPFPIAALVLGFLAPYPTPLSGADFGLDERFVEAGDGRGIADERRYYHRATGLLSTRRTGDMPAHAWAVRGLEARRKREPVVTRNTIGFFGYHAGPAVHVVDLNALSDPLLARIPRLKQNRTRRGRTWRIGHFTRAVPAGYLETLETGLNSIEHPGLASYYDDLERVVTGPLFSAERWKAILALNTGARDPRMESYLDSLE